MVPDADGSCGGRAQGGGGASAGPAGNAHGSREPRRLRGLRRGLGHHGRGPGRGRRTERAVRDMSGPAAGDPREGSVSMRQARSILSGLRLPEADAHDLPGSAKRFADGGQYRIEIPSVEGPRPLAAVWASASQHAVGVHRISQGSGIMLLTDAEISAMLELCRAQGIEVCLFVGPRASWDVGVQAASTSGRILGASLRGPDTIDYGTATHLRAAHIG